MEFKVEPLQNPSIIEQLSRWPIFNFLKTKHIIYGLVILLLIAVIFFFWGRGSFRESGVELKVDGSKEVTGGELVTYKLTYKNSSAVSLSDVKLNIFYPTDSIVVRDGNIINLTTENFDLGTVNSNEAGEKELTAYIVGDSGNIKTLKAVLTYRAGKLSSTFQKEASLATTITTLAVPITFVATPTVISGQSTSYLIDYRNQSSQDLENLRFIFKYPEGFLPNKFSPSSSLNVRGQAIWDIPKLKQGDSSRITIQGILSGNEKETKTVSVTLQKKITTPSGDVYVDFEKSQASSVISTPPLSLELKINDSADYVAHLGDVLKYKILFRNNNDADITGLSLSVRLDGDMYDFVTVKSDGFFDSRQNTIFWNASTVSTLNLLPRNRDGSVEFEVYLRKSFSGSFGASDSFVKVTARLETPNVPSGLDLDKLTAGGELVTRISTAPTFDQKLLVSNPTSGSSGPFPPKVNQKTSLTVNWNLVNPSNDLSQAKVTATLAPGVNWENVSKVSGTGIEPIYDTRLNAVVWDLGTLPAGTGVSFPKFESYFQISITPSTNQVGELVALLKNVRLDGVDTFTKEKITRTIIDVSTNNMSDTNQSGAVQP
ncbi:MAG: hypothetical protein HYT61_02765 [Candidatus Yanofskybacteria bacterium]|nr:hypothetical protein [Candidatus Yanofskybacteria bacterium]